MYKTKIAITIAAFVIIVPVTSFADNATSTLATTTPVTAASSTVSTTTTTVESTLGLQTPAIPQIIQQIQQAKTELAGVKLNYALSPVYKNVKNKKTKKTGKTLTGYNLWAKDVALAILDPATNQVGVLTGMQTGQTMKFSDPNFDVSLKHFNGVNSSFTINKPAGGTVLAMKYLITGPELGSKASIENALQEAVYVPYSDNLNSVAVIAYGESYVTGLIERAAGELGSIQSQAIPGKTVPEAIKPAMIRALVYAEHTDTGVLLNGNVQDTINRLNILFATNQGDAYKYSVSSAGARGIAQFMPATYSALAQRHPEAGLVPDFVQGMSDHYNSIKAMYLLLDDYAGAVRVKAQNGFAEGQVFDYGAAAYNGGTTRVVNAVNAFGSGWNQDQSAQINSLQSQVGTAAAQIKSLRAKIKSTKDKKTKAAYQSELSAAAAQLSDATSQLNTLQSAALRTETVKYLQKIYKVIPVFNDRQI